MQENIKKNTYLTRNNLHFDFEIFEQIKHINFYLKYS